MSSTTPDSGIPTNAVEHAAKHPGNGAVPPAAQKGLTLEALKEATAPGSPAPVATKSVAVTIEVRKPTKDVPFRSHPDMDYTLNAYSLTVKTPNVIGETIYLVHPAIHQMIPTHTRYQMFCLCFDAWQRRPFIWPITIPQEGSRQNSWIVSAMRVWGATKKDWYSLLPDGGAYQLREPVEPVVGEPAWPSKSFNDLMMMAFSDLYLGPEARDSKIVRDRMSRLVANDVE